jgi:hypothetical protein
MCIREKRGICVLEREVHVLERGCILERDRYIREGDVY